jgi:hypothetical protein
LIQQSDIIELHAMLERDDAASYKRGIDWLFAKLGRKEDVPESQALHYLLIYFQSLLNEGRYFEAAFLLWGSKTFDPRPMSVRRIWDAIQKYDKVLCMGSGVQGKSYTAVVWAFLRWLEDPQYTSVKLVSTSAGHLKSNVFGSFVKLHEESVLPLPGLVREDYIGLEVTTRFSAIEKVAIKSGESGTAALRGFHRLPRKKPHPKFGDMSVVVLIMDEADGIPWGAWMGADNMASGGGDAPGTIKIYAATNPIDRASEFAVRAEPMQGWAWVNKDSTMEWDGHQGWRVIRLDARQSENYKERREVYQGLMTYNRAKDYESKGPDHPDVWTFIYGLYPTSSAKYYVVPAFILENIRGTFNFIRTPWNIASFDPAFEEGGDRAILTSGRYGLVNGFRGPNGKLELITPHRWALQIEQQFEVEKKPNPLDMADDLITILKKLRVQPEWFVHDMTGNATLLYGYLTRHFGAVMGLKWQSRATEKRVFEEDRETAEEQFSGLISEMWFSFSRWAQFGYVKIAPMMQTQELFNEASSRKYEQVSKTLMQVETKADYKANNSGKSPDYTDSMIMGVHLCRIRGQDMAAMVKTGNDRELPPDFWRGEDDWRNFDAERNKGQLQSIVDKIPFIEFNE